ncbi:MAG TPA: type III PLP-dependent enzyme [Fibrobacteria bacterium]|nr:type III PLP-dependent enzyme [Fibrobacteria bacterium]
MNASSQSVPGRFPSRGGELIVGGRPISDIAREHGSPLYVYDLAVLRARRAELRAALPGNLLITYAVKANPEPGIVRALGALYDGVDIASGGEMRVALAAGVPAAKMSFAGPGKSREEIRFAVERDIGTLSLESERELDHIEEACASLGRAAGVMVRVNPDFEFTRSGLKMGGGSKQFGIDSERVPALIQRLSASRHARFQGIHIFSGTQNLNADSVVDAFRKIAEYTVGLRAATGAEVRTLNLGGGFGIPYFKGDQPLDLARTGEGIGALLAEFAPRLPGTAFKVELGRYLVGECGVYLARVRYRKESRGQAFLILDGGMHHHLAASGNISQSPIRRQMRLLAANRLDAPVEKVNVVGPLCTPLDTFGLGVELPRLEEGDFVAIPNSGAYGISMSPASFLGHPHPKEVLVDGEAAG